MKRKFAIGTVLALVLVLGVTVTAMAAGPGPNYGDDVQAGYAGQGAAIHDSFVDGDLDGECDNYVLRTQFQDGTGNHWSGIQSQQVGQGTPGANFVDDDGDGVCESCLGDGTQFQDGASQQMRRSGRLNP